MCVARKLGFLMIGAWHHDLTQTRHTAELARFAQKDQR